MPRWPQWPLSCRFYLLLILTAAQHVLLEIGQTSQDSSSLHQTGSRRRSPSQFTGNPSILPTQPQRGPFGPIPAIFLDQLWLLKIVPSTSHGLVTNHSLPSSRGRVSSLPGRNGSRRLVIASLVQIDKPCLSLCLREPGQPSAVLHSYLKVCTVCSGWLMPAQVLSCRQLRRQVFCSRKLG